MCTRLQEENLRKYMKKKFFEMGVIKVNYVISDTRLRCETTKQRKHL